MSYFKTILKESDTYTDSSTLYLPSTMLKRWKIKNTRIHLRFGQAREEVRVQEITSSKLPILPIGLRQRLRVPTGIPVILSYHAERRVLTIGPFMGILIVPGSTTSQAPFGMLTPFLQEVSDLCRQRGGVVCAFQPNDVDWSTGSVRAMVRKGTSWKPELLPLPQCIYNRLPNRKTEALPDVENFILLCKEWKIPYFNHRFLDKWEVHQALSRHPEIREFLPYSEIYKDAQRLQRLLDHFQILYVKPTSGSMGRGIYRLTKGREGTYRLSYPTATGSTSKVFRNISGLHSALRERMQDTTYLVQQGINILRHSERPIDFRILVQKNERGEWSVTSLVARVGQNKVVSNVARGGKMMSARQALLLGQSSGMTEYRPTTDALRRTAIKIARSIDATIPGLYAELGIDLAVDTVGRIWLLEVNSKPSKAENTLQQPESTTEGAEPQKSVKTIRPSVRRLYDYVTFVCGFSNSKKQGGSRLRQLSNQIRRPKRR